MILPILPFLLGHPVYVNQRFRYKICIVKPLLGGQWIQIHALSNIIISCWMSFECLGFIIGLITFFQLIESSSEDAHRHMGPRKTIFAIVFCGSITFRNPMIWTSQLMSRIRLCYTIFFRTSHTSKVIRNLTMEMDNCGSRICTILPIHTNVNLNEASFSSESFFLEFSL